MKIQLRFARLFLVMLLPAIQVSRLIPDNGITEIKIVAKRAK